VRGNQIIKCFLSFYFLLTKTSYEILTKALVIFSVMRLRSVGRAVGQLTVGWRVGKARERGNVCKHQRQGFIAASQLAHNDSGIGGVVALMNFLSHTVLQPLESAWNVWAA
jgi:hypothetical protein